MPRSRERSRNVEGMEDIFWMSACGLSEVISCFCAIHLWRSGAGVLKKVVWTLFLFFPVLGPIAYGGFFTPPEPHDNQDNSEAIGGDGD